MSAQNPHVTIIPASLDCFTLQPLAQTVKKRVAAYARVSTKEEEQLNSYETQVAYYTEHIQSNPDWEFVEVYADEGISATNTKKRTNFNRMLADALAGKIDLILTKSISRFARNTVDTLSAVRSLKEKGVEVYFEKENIHTLDSKGELLITIMSSLAQEESRSISENVTWGQRKRMMDGKVTMPYRRFLGYRKGADGKPEIVEEEAETVRRIYALFLSGSPYRDIAKTLTNQGVPTPGGKTVWSVSTVKSILQNEKYAGNAILQKKYTVDFLTKKVKTNEGEVPQYFVQNSHPAIVSVSDYDLAQAEVRRRSAESQRLIGSKLFCGRIRCGACGGAYGLKVWHSTAAYRKTVWRCNNKYGKKLYCATPHLTEAELQQAFLQAWRVLLTHKDRYASRYMSELSELENMDTLHMREAELQAECEETASLAQACIAKNATSVQNQEEYRKQYDDLTARYDRAKEQLDALQKEKLERIAQKERLCRFMAFLKQTENAPTAFDEKLWRKTVESITVHTRDKVIVRFQSGTEIPVSVDA